MNNILQAVWFQFGLIVLAIFIIVGIIINKFYLHDTNRTPEENDLLEAARKGNLDKVKQLINSGVNKNTRGSEQTTPLMLAAFNFHQEIVDYLVSQGVNVNAQNSFGSTALIMLLHQLEPPGRPKGGLPIKDIPFTGNSPEQNKAAKNIIKALHAAGTDLNLQDNQGDTAIELLRKLNMEDLLTD